MRVEQIMRFIVFAMPLAGLALLLSAACSEAQERANYCRYGDSSSLLVIDRTSAYDDNDRRKLIQSAGAVADSLGVGDRLTVVTIGAHYSDSRTVFDACRPGCPETRNPFASCATMIALRDERQFRARLIHALRPLTQNTDPQTHSDIAATLSQATRNPSDGRVYADVNIFSDMLENSQALPWTTFRDQSAEASMEVVSRYGIEPSVRGARVRIVGFGRLHDAARTPLTPELDQRIRGFWNGYFRTGGARQVSFLPVIAADS